MPQYCPHCHSALPSTQTATGERFRCGSCGAWLEPSPPVSYGQQFVHNPLGTYFFGPRLAEYQASRSVDQAARRRRHFRRWVYLLVVMCLAAVLLPLLAGLLRRDMEVALGGVLVGLLAFFWPALFFLMGMLMYAAAWFEWRWFFRSATLRHARGMFGDSGARSFYLIFGGVLMVGGALFSLGGSLVIAGSFLLVPAKQGLAGGGPGTPRQRIHVAERTVEQCRQLFESNAQPLRERLAQVQRLRARIREQPHDLELRTELRDAERPLPKLHADYRLFRDQWQTAVQKLQQRVAETGGSSRVLEQNRDVPPELDFSDGDVAVEQPEFPLADVRVATTRLRAGWQNLRQLADAQSPAPPPILERLLRDVEQQRNFLMDVERRWRYRSPALDELPPPDELDRVVAAVRGESRRIAAANPPLPAGRPEQVAGPADAETPRAPSGTRREPAQPPVTPPPVAFDPRHALDSAAGPGPPDPQPAGPPRAPFPARNLPLLPLFNPDQHTLRGTVIIARTAGGPSLQTEALAEHVLCYFPGPALLASYEFEANITRLEGDGGFFFVLPIQGRSAALVIDGGDDLGHRTGLVAMDNQVLSSPRYPAPLLTGTQLPRGQPVHLACGVDAQGLRLRVDGKEVYRWQGDPARLSLPPFYRSPHRAHLHAGSFHSRFRVEGIALRKLHAVVSD